MTSQLHSYLHINHGKIAHDVIDGEVVLVNTHNGFYYSLRGTAVGLWSCLQGGQSLVELKGWIARTYGLGQAEADAAVTAFVDELVADEVLLPSDVPPPPVGQPIAFERATNEPYSSPVVERFTEMQDLLTLDPIHEVDDLGWPHPTIKLG